MREKIIENGKLVMPLTLCKKSEIIITSNYGNRLHPKKKIWHNHTGIDVVTPHKLAIVEMPDSYEITNDDVNGLRFRGTYKDSGIDLYIVHLATYLGYTATIGTKKVLVVGMMGTSGSSTGPHYHIEVRKKQALIDPTDTVTNLKFPLISL